MQHTKVDNGYNGWTNYATWKVNLEIVSDLADSLHDDGVTEPDVYDLAQLFRDQVEELIAQEGALDGTLALDYAQCFLAQVNWREIAEAYADDLVRSDDDDEEEEEEEES